MRKKRTSPSGENIQNMFNNSTTELNTTGLIDVSSGDPPLWLCERPQYEELCELLGYLR